MNINEAIECSIKSIGGSEANIDSQYLLSFILQKKFTWLKTWPETILSQQQETLLFELVKRRKQGEPIAFITGERDFWTLTLETNPSTLIPRPETELLVEKALEFLKDLPKAKILDLGTGTGAIALAIASERKNDKVIATDYVEDVVDLAKRNAIKNKISNVEIFQSDWFSKIKETEFDLIVSNPPYVEENDPHLNQGDLRFEPKSALTAGDNGLADIKIIIEESRSRLVNGGKVMIEHGYCQANDLREIFRSFGYQKIKVIKDLAGLDRISTGVFLH
jgi:release factor glutamine methyltransferase